MSLVSLKDQRVETDTIATTKPERIHIRGLDDLTTNDISAFSIEHYPHHPPTRIEWVDDSSANIVFNDPATASNALERFTLAEQKLDVSALPSVHLREAKALSTHPELRLQVRAALSTDRKRPRAYEASRFYMMHPEYDPRKQRRRSERCPQHSDGVYRRRRYGDEEQRRRRHKDHEEGFDPSMYDDDKLSSKQVLMDMFSGNRINDEEDRGHHHRHSNRPERNRSASPKAHGNMDAKRRLRTPPPSYSSRDPYPFPSENEGKELFPSKSSNGEHTKRVKDLFSNKLLAAELKKDLFPRKGNTLNYHRRCDAFDAADETADLFATRLSVPLADKSKVGRGLTDRINHESSTTSYGRLAAPDPEPTLNPPGDIDDDGISILGASSQQSQGFSILGGAAAAGTIKELFPGKASGNGGKELFAEKIWRRGGRRNRAADMFH